MSDDEFLAAFEACTLPRADWSHAAHVRMAWLYLTRLPFATALDAVRGGIQRYNASVGSDGYHETITVAFTHLIRSRVAVAVEDFAAFASRHPDLFEGRGGLLGRHYDPETLTWLDAKSRFVEPDREPLPGRRDGRMRLIDVSHTVEHGMVTYRGLPAPVVCDFLSREQSWQHYAPGVEFHIGKVEMVANTGTYLDSPFHRYADGTDLAGLPLLRGAGQVQGHGHVPGAGVRDGRGVSFTRTRSPGRRDRTK